MQFKKYGDGKYRAFGLIEDENGEQVRAMFTTKVHPSEVTGWELSSVVTSEGDLVMVPRSETVDVQVDEISITKQTDLTPDTIKVNWA